MFWLDQNSSDDVLEEDHTVRDQGDEALLATLRSKLGEVEPWEFRKARGMANPYEGLGNGGYVCRSGLKLAELDDLAQMTKGERFIDVCAAPGGFSQYLIHRGLSGVAMSLCGENRDGRGLEMRFSHSKLQILEGDLYDDATLEALIAPADLVVADGGFDASRDNPDQDASLVPLVVREFVVALRSLRDDGNALVKLFLPLRAEGTLNVIDLAHRYFQRIALVKPTTSRPASGEVYLVALGYQPGDNVAAGRGAKDLLHRFSPSDDDEQWMTKVPPVTPPPPNRRLTAYVDDRRAALVRDQATACQAILDYVASSSRDDDDDASKQSLCRDALRRWGLPRSSSSSSLENDLPRQFRGGKRRRRRKQQ